MCTFISQKEISMVCLKTGGTSSLESIPYWLHCEFKGVCEGSLPRWAQALIILYVKHANERAVAAYTRITDRKTYR